MNEQNQRLRNENAQLKRQLERLTNLVKNNMEQQVERNPNGQSDDLLQEQLKNAQKLVESYRKELYSLKKMLIYNPESQANQLIQLKQAKELEIEYLKAEIQLLKKSSSQTQKLLMQTEQSDPSCFRDYQRLLQDYDQIKKKCEHYEKQLRKEDPMPQFKEVPTQAYVSEINKITKEMEILRKVAESDRKRRIVLEKQLVKIREEKEELADRLRMKEKDIFVVRQGIRTNLGNNSTNKARNTARIVRDRLKHPSPEAHSLPKLPKNHLYPRIQQFGQTLPDNTPFNDLKYCSRIKAIRLFYNQDSTIRSIHCQYERGPTLQPTQELHEQVVFQTCLQHIQGQFDNLYLAKLWLIGIDGDVHRLPKKSRKGQMFKFAIEKYEYPSCLFGETVETTSGRRINKIGCFIQKL